MIMFEDFSLIAKFSFAKWIGEDGRNRRYRPTECAAQHSLPPLPRGLEEVDARIGRARTNKDGLRAFLVDMDKNAGLHVEQESDRLGVDDEPEG